MPTATLGQDATPQPGERRLGFSVTRVTPLPNLRATAIELTHEKTGARLLHLHAPSDSENLFSIAIPTPPGDNTGLPHILEHCVLGGSRRFPVKDPFFEMVKSSMATFINAMTAADFTVYPVASNVRQDFYNLAEVYWDAVFHPTLTELTFMREAHHLELADRNDPASELNIQGIVFNEMKGAMSAPERRLAAVSDRALFPDTPYGFNAGGEPGAIPDLRYDDFLDFHRRLYHPSNAFIFLYGDIPTADHLVFLGPKLDGFSAQPTSPPTPRQPRFTSPRTAVATYALAPGQPTAERSFVVMRWIVGDAGDSDDVAAMAALDRVLLGNQGAPLRKALIDSGLGSDLVSSGLDVWSRDMNLSVGLKGTEPDRAAAIERVILDTLTRLAEQGMPRAAVDAAFQQLAYSHREVTSQFPLSLLWRAQVSWLHTGDPIPGLLLDRALDRLRTRCEADPDLFPRLIRDRLLNNPHRLTVTLTPDPDLTAREEAAFAERMRQRKAAMTGADLRRVVDQQTELERLMNTPNTPEALATLPQLKVTDLPRKPREVPTTVELIGNVEVLRNEVFASGVNYLHLSLDLSALPEEDWAYLPLLSDCVSKMGAAGEDYAATAARSAANTGGIAFGAGATGRVDDPNTILRRGTFTLRFLDERTDGALQLLEDLIFSLDVVAAARLREVLLQARAHHRTRPAYAGMQIALAHAQRPLSAAERLGCTMRGVPMTRLIESLATAEDGVEALATKLDAIRRVLLSACRPTASFTGSPDAYDAVARRLASWSSRLNQSPAAAAPIEPADGTPIREAFAAPMDVAYCTASVPAPHISEADAPLISVGSRYVSGNYVLEEVRFKGTAYGGGCGYDGLSGTFSFHSYRDPHVRRTLDVFHRSVDYVQRDAWSRSDVERAIIITAKSAERPIRPGEATGQALWRHLSGDTPARREARHVAVLAATPQAVREAMLRCLEPRINDASVCVVSSRRKLEAANRELGDASLPIQDIAPVS
jgi:Zn-dependent M16 (insulinase) family peptidase